MVESRIARYRRKCERNLVKEVSDVCHLTSCDLFNCGVWQEALAGLLELLQTLGKTQKLAYNVKVGGEGQSWNIIKISMHLPPTFYQSELVFYQFLIRELNSDVAP